VTAEARGSRRLAVLTLINSVSRIGGAERLVADMLLRLDPNRFDRVVCTTRPPPGPTFEGDLRNAGVEVLSLARGPKFDVLSWRPLIALLRRRRIDVLHAHKFGSNVWGTAFARLTGVPVFVAHEHMWSYEGQPLRRFLDRRVVAKQADAVLTVCAASRQAMIEVERVNASKVRVLPNGIPAPAPNGRAVRRELGIAPDVPVIGTVTVLRPEKRLDLLIESAARLRSAYPGLKVLIAGRGVEDANLRSLIATMGLEDTVVLLGPRGDVPDLLEAMDVAVCCSDFEGSPISVLEYMAMAKPIVASRVGGIPELIDHETHGLLVGRGDVGGLTDAVQRLLADPRLAATLGARAQERQRREFSIEATVRSVEALYEELFLLTKRARDEGWTPAAHDADTPTSAFRPVSGFCP
jgi:glycosyltransferase involved in cell wall biosynthesis